jgi:glycosyltransferase involved in cell wall biosynthesis
MKILLLSTFDTASGSALAARRLQKGLQNAGATAQMLVQTKYTNDPSIYGSQSKLEDITAKFRRALDALPLKLLYRQRSSEFSIPWLADRVNSRVAQINPDLINLHWINYNFLQIETIAKFNQPVVWTLHDMWAFTGGCHYSQDCDRYIHACGSCPQLYSSKDQDLSHWIWQRKAKTWQEHNLTIVTPSVWLAKCAGSSSLFEKSRIEVIPNGINTNIYKPIDQQLARSKFGLPQDKQLIFFGAMNATSSQRKGFHLLQPALQRLFDSDWRNKIELVVFGSSQSDAQDSLNFKTHYLGKLSDDDSLAQAYSAADVFVAPSVQDNLPNTVMEAISCGTPCIAFSIGGMPDMIEHQGNGYLAQPHNTEELAQGIAWVLEDRERHQKLGDRARKKAEQEFTLEIQAHRYLSLFSELLEHAN